MLTAAINPKAGGDDCHGGALALFLPFAIITGSKMIVHTSA
jgi:hypothetical protein